MCDLHWPKWCWTLCKKMVHNGIEYGDMQLIAESYDLMKQILGLSVDEMAEIFQRMERRRIRQLPYRDHG